MGSITASKMCAALKAAKVTHVVALPDSRLFELQTLIKSDPAFSLMEVANEGEGIAICAGLWAGGKRCVIMMEDSGFFEGALALEKYGNQNEMPVVMIAGYHAPTSEGRWFQVHRAAITRPLLDALEIPHTVVEDDLLIDRVVVNAFASAYASKRPVAILCGGRVV